MIVAHPTPDRPLAVRSTLLRSVLLVILDDANGCEVTVSELCTALAARGFTVRGRPSKVVSDALRVEVDKGRAVRVGRGRYAVGAIARTTRWRCRQRVRDAARGRVRACHIALPPGPRHELVLRERFAGAPHHVSAQPDSRAQHTSVVADRRVETPRVPASRPLAAPSLPPTSRDDHDGAHPGGPDP